MTLAVVFHNSLSLVVSPFASSLLSAFVFFLLFGEFGWQFHAASLFYPIAVFQPRYISLLDIVVHHTMLYNE